MTTQIEWIEHQNGIMWLDAPPPFVIHRHKPQTTAILADGDIVHRCPCGAFGDRNGNWRLLDKPRRRWIP